MRVTNTMLKQASLSSGLPLAHSTLLDHLNNDSNDLMANALKSRNQMVKITGYEKLKKAAEELMENSKKLSEDLWYDSLSKTAEEKISKTGEKSNENKQAEVTTTLGQIVKAYNDTSNALLKDTNTMNQFYRQELTKAIKNGVKDLGLTLSKSGTLAFDADKMKKDMSVEELQERLQPVAKKLAFISEHIADNATANINSASTRYGASGNSYYDTGNRYDFRG